MKWIGLPRFVQRTTCLGVSQLYKSPPQKTGNLYHVEEKWLIKLLPILFWDSNHESFLRLVAWGALEKNIKMLEYKQRLSSTQFCEIVRAESSAPS